MLDMLMFWKKKKNPADSAAHLADLLGPDAADRAHQTIAGETHIIDFNTELFDRDNFAVAKLVVIAGLLKNDDRQRSKILRSVKPENLGSSSFESYLFTLILDSLQATGNVSPSQISQQIYQYRPKAGAQPSSTTSVESNFFNWSLILGLEPTPAQITQALKIISPSPEEQSPPIIP